VTSATLLVVCHVSIGCQKSRTKVLGIEGPLLGACDWWFHHCLGICESSAFLFHQRSLVSWSLHGTDGLLRGWDVLLYGGVPVLQSGRLVFGQQPCCMAKTCGLGDDVRGHTWSDVRPEGQKSEGPVSRFGCQEMRCHAFALVGWITHDLFCSVGVDPT